MKKILFPVMLLIFTACKAQTTDPNKTTAAYKAYDIGEFGTYSNGLIYSDSTMLQLTHIVDSLNLRFKRCDLTRKYYAISQGIGHSVSLEKGNIKQALADIKANISFEDFVKKYKAVEVDKEMLILKARYFDHYSKKWVVQFSGEVLKDYDEPSISIDNDPSFYDKALQCKWVVKYYDKKTYSNESLDAFFITEEFKGAELPVKYARMILYSDCVIDTTADVFTSKKDDEDIFSRTGTKGGKKSKLDIFLDYITGSTKHITEKDVPASYEYKWHALDSMKTAWIIANLAPTAKFKQLLADAVTEVKQKDLVTNDEFENYVANYASKSDALAMKRNRRVMGQCSMDQSPRLHAVNIAMLSAETINWEVFLRAHLNIMNDRFDRVSDGSWAWAARKTYIKELEELNIDVHELLLGISLRIENPVSKHYYGSIGRLGRALSETKDRARLENNLLDMIRDNELDAYNRMLMHYLYLNYTYYLPTKEERLATLKKLEEADKSLPVYIASRIKINKKNFEKVED